MILHLHAHSPATLTDAHNTLADLTRTWGQNLTITPPADSPHSPDSPDSPDDPDTHPGKVVDPISLAALVVSIPAAVLAAVDLTDRIRARRRATDLIETARHLADQGVTIHIIDHTQPLQITELTPDQLLDHASTDDLDAAPDTGDR